MKKKLLSAVLSAAFAAVVLSSLAACGGGEPATEPIGSVTSSETQQEPAGQQTTQNNAGAASIEETVMWDDDVMKVTAMSLTEDNYYHILNLQIENKTDRDLYIMASRSAVNSFVEEPSMGVDVPAGSTAEGELKFFKKDVDADVIADIETRFSYSSSDRYYNSKTERVKLETSAAATYDYSYDESGTVLHEADGIRIVCQGFNDEGNPMIYVSSTGELSEGCFVEDLDVYINGKETESDMGAWVFTNTRNIAELELEDEDRDGNALGEVESLKVSFKISKENMADSDPVKTELVEIPLE